MALFGLHHELKHIGATLNRWQAEAQGFLWLAAALGGLWLLALTDLFLRYERAGRLVAFGFIAIILGAGLRQIFAALSRKGSIQAIAARIEHAFPALDNYLINVVQFEARGLRNPLEAAYVAQGVPGWNMVRVNAMRNWREIVRGLTILLSAGVPVHIVSARLGHANPIITMNVYAHCLPRAPQGAVAVLESMGAERAR